MRVRERGRESEREREGERTEGSQPYAFNLAPHQWYSACSWFASQVAEVKSKALTSAFLEIYLDKHAVAPDFRDAVFKGACPCAPVPHTAAHLL